MMKTSLINYKTLQITMLQLKRIQLKSSVNKFPPNITSCLCGQPYTNQRQNSYHSILSKQKCVKSSYHNVYFFKRIHSTYSDQHRQKVVIETTTPSVIDKVRLDKELPVEKNVELKRAFWRDKIDPYVKLARWDRPIGVYLLFWPCSWSIALASIPGNVSLYTTLHTTALFLVGAGLMRGAGCTINDMWDKDVDSQVERTKDRPLVSGVVSDRQALGFLAAQLTLALGVLLQLNWYSVALGASSMLLVVTYPLAKRFTNYPQIFLGATFNWGALLGYTAIQGTFEPTICLPLYFGALAWTVVYDTIYAHQDKEDDARIGMKSTALTFGSHTKPALSAALCCSAACLAFAGHNAGLEAPYGLALAAYVLHAGRQIYTLDPDNPNDCAKKFKSNSLVGLFILLGILGGGFRKYIDNRKESKELVKV